MTFLYAILVILPAIALGFWIRSASLREGREMQLREDVDYLGIRGTNEGRNSWLCAAWELEEKMSCGDQ